MVLNKHGDDVSCQAGIGMACCSLTHQGGGVLPAQLRWVKASEPACAWTQSDPTTALLGRHGSTVHHCKTRLEGKKRDCIFLFLTKKVSLFSHSSALDGLRKLLVAGKSSYENVCSQLLSRIPLLRIRFQNKIREAPDFLFLWSFLLKPDMTSL